MQFTNTNGPAVQSIRRHGGYLRDVKISNVLNAKVLPFFAEKCEELLQCKCSLYIFGGKLPQLIL